MKVSQAFVFHPLSPGKFPKKTPLKPVNLFYLVSHANLGNGIWLALLKRKSWNFWYHLPRTTDKRPKGIAIQYYHLFTTSVSAPLNQLLAILATHRSSERFSNVPNPFSGKSSRDSKKWEPD